MGVTQLLIVVIWVSCRCRYVGIDVSSPFLQEARCNLVDEGIDPGCIEMVEGEYMQGLKKVRAMHPDENLCIMWLGSSVGNFTDEGAIQFFRDIYSAVGTRCQIFLCAGNQHLKPIAIAIARFVLLCSCSFGFSNSLTQVSGM